MFEERGRLLALTETGFGDADTPARNVILAARGRKRRILSFETSNDIAAAGFHPNCAILASARMPTW